MIHLDLGLGPFLPTVPSAFRRRIEEEAEQVVEWVEGQGFTRAWTIHDAAVGAGVGYHRAARALRSLYLAGLLHRTHDGATVYYARWQ